MLVKGSRAVGLERVGESSAEPRAGDDDGRDPDRRDGGDADLHLPRPKFIEYLRLKEFGQHIREEGPEEHHEKAGTPTMGGLIVFTAIAVPYLVLSDRDTQSLAVFGVALGCAAWVSPTTTSKIVKRRSLGLSARWKLLFQIGLALGLWWVATEEVGLDSTSSCGSRRQHRPRAGPLPVLIFLVIAGRLATRSTSPTGSTGSPPAAARSSCSPTPRSPSSPTGRRSLALLSACLVGACVGFLWFNAFPASIFMGDTGSLGLGGAIGALAVMTQTEVLLIIIGGIFVIEALSVALQVFTFKTFRRRVLPDGPVHHHFELMAWSETKIMLRFWIIAAVCSGIGFTLYQNSIGLARAIGGAAR